MGNRRRLVDGFLKLVYSDIAEGGQPELLMTSIKALLGGGGTLNGWGGYIFLILFMK